MAERGTEMSEKLNLNYKIKFCNESGEVGCFDFSKSPVTFTGDADIAAKVFIDLVIEKWMYSKIARLEEYAMHKSHCKFEPMESPCTCGLDELMECK